MDHFSKIAHPRGWITFTIANSTNAWRSEIGYNRIDKGVITTAEAYREQIWKAAQRIYQNYPELLEAARITLGVE